MWRACSHGGERCGRWRRGARAGDRQTLQQDPRTDGRAGFLGQEARSMSAPTRRAKVERTGAELSVRRQCALLNVARSGVYRTQPETSAESCGGSTNFIWRNRSTARAKWRSTSTRKGAGSIASGCEGLMRLMGLEGLVPRPGTSKTAPGNKIYPYLRGVSITEANHVWAPTSPTYRWPAACCIWRLSSTGRAARCAPALLFDHPWSLY